MKTEKTGDKFTEKNRQPGVGNKPMARDDTSTITHETIPGDKHKGNQNRNSMKDKASTSTTDDDLN